jgi:hypothetical protein
VTIRLKRRDYLAEAGAAFQRVMAVAFAASLFQETPAKG